MSGTPLVSVVIPCLNREKFLAPTIESVLQQDYPHVECIVVDGGSTDGTLEILKRYGDKIRWISEPDKGPADAINKGWRMCRGEILAWLNADDLWKVPDAVSQAVAFLQGYADVDVVYGDCGSIDTKGDLIGMSYLHEWDLGYAVENCDHCIPQPAAFIRRAVLEKVNWLDTNLIFMDRDLWYRIGLVGTIRYFPVLLAHARNTASYWSSKADVVASDCVQIVRKFYKDPNLHESFMRIKRRAISNSYLRGMHYAWEGGRHGGLVFTYGLRAALADFSNARNAYYRLRDYASRGAEENKRWKLGLLVLELPAYPVRLVRRLKQGPVIPRIPNLLGDREIEWSWITAHLPSGTGEALDFGAGASPLALAAAQCGYRVTAIDLEEVRWRFVHPAIRFLRGDLLKLPLQERSFDLVINCSTVEHVGLVGRYGVVERRPDGDLEAMSRLYALLKPGGVMLLTIPVGQDAVFDPICRVYGKQRLPLLLQNYLIEEEAYWVKDDTDHWILSDKESALQFPASAASWDPRQNIYALGCFVLRRPEVG